ncbi:efflux RND transporter periplasmic adaptor subunit [Thalassotalea ganghwensis]
MNKIFPYGYCLLVLVFTLNSYAQEQKAQLVSVDKAKLETVQPGIWLPANVVSRNEAPISAELTGQLLSVLEVGDEVKKGDVIAQIDNRHLQLQLEKQLAKVAQQKANVDFLSKQQKRLSSLKKANNASVSELERVIKDLIIAQSEVSALNADIKQTKLLISKTQIVAPFNGNISERMVSVGELITSGRPLVKLVDTQQLDIQVAAPISVAPFIAVNKHIMVKWQDKLLELPVRSWSKAGHQGSRTFNVLLNADGVELFAGSAVSVSLPKGKLDQAVMIPRDALFLRENETFVLTVSEETANKVFVSVGQGQGEWISVKGDITAGDNVIIRGGERIRQGQKVRIAEPLIARN